jgi:hypothetical protein
MSPAPDVVDGSSAVPVCVMLPVPAVCRDGAAEPAWTVAPAPAICSLGAAAPACVTDPAPAASTVGMAAPACVVEPAPVACTWMVAALVQLFPTRRARDLLLPFISISLGVSLVLSTLASLLLIPFSMKGSTAWFAVALPQFVPSITSTSNNPSNAGQSNIDLRGLGSNRVLVLMDGRRVVPANGSRCQYRVDWTCHGHQRDRPYRLQLHLLGHSEPSFDVCYDGCGCSVGERYCRCRG